MFTFLQLYLFIYRLLLFSIFFSFHEFILSPAKYWCWIFNSTQIRRCLFYLYGWLIKSWGTHFTSFGTFPSFFFENGVPLNKLNSSLTAQYLLSLNKCRLLLNRKTSLWYVFEVKLSNYLWQILSFKESISTVNNFGCFCRIIAFSKLRELKDFVYSGHCPAYGASS